VGATEGTLSYAASTLTDIKNAINTSSLAEPENPGTSLTPSTIPGFDFNAIDTGNSYMHGQADSYLDDIQDVAKQTITAAVPQPGDCFGLTYNAFGRDFEFNPCAKAVYLKQGLGYFLAIFTIYYCFGIIYPVGNKP